MKHPRAPEHLESSTRQWWSNVVRDWNLEEHHVRLLTLAAEAWDRCEAARAQIDAEGLTAVDRFEQVKLHPLLPIERDNRLAFARLLRELRLDDPEPEGERLPRSGKGPDLKISGG